jgi:hypothetical protein
MTQAALPLLAALPPPVFAEHAAAERLQHMSIEAAPQAQRHEQQVLQPPLLSTYQEEKSPSGRPPIHQRHTASSRLHALADPETECAAEIRAVLRSGEQQPHGSSVLAQLPAGVAEYARRRGESMRELVERKRQIFRAQMSLDTKRSEIAKLEQRTRQWDEALLVSGCACRSRRPSRLAQGGAPPHSAPAASSSQPGPPGCCPPCRHLRRPWRPTSSALRTT